jgi:signal transduction histidine kinase
MSNDKNPKTVFGNRIFQDVYPEDVKINISSKNFIEVNEGEIIYQTGDNSDSLYLLLKGQVKIKVYGSIGGTSLIKKFADDFFGEIELLENTPRKSTAIAVEKSLLYFISGNELQEFTKNKIICTNLFGQTSAISPANEESKDVFDDEINNINWDTTSTDEFKDIFDEDILDNSVEGNYPSEDIEEIDYDKTDLSGSLNLTKNSFQDIPVDESEPLSDMGETKDTIDNGGDSILDRIKEEIKDRIPELEEKQEEDITDSKEEIYSASSISAESKLDDKEQIPPEIISDETSSVGSNVTQQEQAEQLSDNEYHEVIKKVVESIYDEVKNPTELIKKYADFLLQKSASPFANIALQKIIDQSNNIIASLHTHVDYFNEKIKLKAQVLYVTHVLNDILRLLAGYTEFRKVKLFRKYEADASILLDKNLFYQACLQIIKFLCENISAEGNIFVTVSRTKETIIIKFKSSGPKLPDEMLKNLFEYFMINKTPGLLFAKKIIAEHEGAISAENSIEAGPEIKVLLPIVN